MAKADRSRIAQLDAAVASKLSELDLRTWVVDYLRWIDWGTGTETQLLRVEDAALWEGEPRSGQAPGLAQIDAGTLRITSRRVMFAGMSQHRVVRFPRLATWSYGDEVLSLGAEESSRIWHFADLTRANAFLGAVPSISRITSSMRSSLPLIASLSTISRHTSRPLTNKKLLRHVSRLPALPLTLRR